jgi:hypothetical protein
MSLLAKLNVTGQAMFIAVEIAQRNASSQSVEHCRGWQTARNAASSSGVLKIRFRVFSALLLGATV